MADEGLYAHQNRLRAREVALVNAKRIGKEGTQSAAVLEREIAVLNEQIISSRTNVQSLKTALSNLVGELVLPLTPQQLVSQLADRLPCLLFPVRIADVHDERDVWCRSDDHEHGVAE